MTTDPQDADSATLEDLRIYRRMPSLRATAKLANSHGVRRIEERCPWYAIRAAEGLATPARRHWAELKLPLMTTRDLAGILTGARRTAQRVDQKKGDYNGTGPVRATATKPDAAAPIGLPGLARIVPVSPASVVAIGELGVADIPYLRTAGAACWA